jgi:hypothetical protein
MNGRSASYWATFPRRAGISAVKVGAFLESKRAAGAEGQGPRAVAAGEGHLETTGSYKTMGHDPYKMVARLVVLCEHDRRGPMWKLQERQGPHRNARRRRRSSLSARIELSGKVPEPGEPLTDEETGDVPAVSCCARATSKMQQLNTGLGGFKTEGVKAIDERLGDPKARENPPRRLCGGERVGDVGRSREPPAGARGFP